MTPGSHQTGPRTEPDWCGPADQPPLKLRRSAETFREGGSRTTSPVLARVGHDSWSDVTGLESSVQSSAAVPLTRHADELTFADVRRRVSAIFVGSIGNLVEWYDFYAYAAFALYFAGSFFPGSDPVVQQLNAAILFAFGFIVRPIGGWLFGHLADHYGRRNALMLSVLLMCFGSLMIAVTPTYASIGVAAPVLLGLARHGSGAEPRRRVRHERDVPQRGRRREASRLLFELPVRDADRRPAVRDSRPAAAAAGVPDARAAAGMGLAHSVRRSARCWRSSRW